MIYQTQIRDRIDGTQITGTDLLRRGSRPFGRGLPHCKLLGGLDQTPVVLPAVIFIGDKLAVGIGGGADLAYMGGTVVIPTVLIPPHELEAHWFTRGLGEDGGSLRDIVVAAMAISARTLLERAAAI